jgi:hypothetical protein
MSVSTWAARAAACLLMVSGVPAVAEAQEEAAVKGGVAISRLSSDAFWDDRIVTTSFGGHVRFRVAGIGLQPELHVVTRGATASAATESEQFRLEYIELPLLVVLPVRMGDLELFGFGGPDLMLESRCRWVVREQGLRTNFPCDQPGDNTFRRTAFDYGVVAGGGLSYALLGGRIALEARHTWGLRDISREGDGVRNRTFSVLLGYSMSWIPPQQDGF